MDTTKQQCLKAIDLMMQDKDWDAAHRIVQYLSTPIARWIHAVLHKIQEDESNSRYWHNKSMLEAYETDNNSQYELHIKPQSLCILLIILL